MDTVRVIEVVETTLMRRGNGKDTPIRIITQYWSKDGELLAERDPSPDEMRTIEALQNQVDAMQNAALTGGKDVPSNGVVEKEF